MPPWHRCAKEGLKMGDNYTPTTDEVCQAYSEETGFDIAARVADFERWLAAHNAVVERGLLNAERDLAKAWREGLAAGMKFSQSRNGNYAKNREAFLVNPYDPNA